MRFLPTLAFAVIHCLTYSQTFKWQGGSGNWSDASNWSINGQPAPTAPGVSGTQNADVLIQLGTEQNLAIRVDQHIDLADLKILGSSQSTIGLVGSGSIHTSAFSVSSARMGSQVPFNRNPDLFSGAHFSGNMDQTAANGAPKSGERSGCLDTGADTITASCPPFLTYRVIVYSDYNGWDISCAGLSDGKIRVEITSGNNLANIYYSFDGGAYGTSDSLTGLDSDPVGITVIDSSIQIVPGVYATCASAISLDAPDPLLMQTPSITFPSCPGVCDGQIAPLMIGGACNQPYTYDWPDDGQVADTATNLCGGFHTLEVTDANGCSFTTNIFLYQPSPLDPGFDITNVLCNGDCNGEVISNPSGGWPGSYTFDWSPDPVNGDGTDSIYGLCPGSYSLHLADDSLCAIDTAFSIIEPAVLTVSAINPVDPSCFGICDGSITALPTGGTGPFTFDWVDAVSGISTGVTDSIATTLCAGTYYVISTDVNGCTAQSANVTLTEPLEIVANLSSTPASCFGICDGSASVAPTDGIAPYTYLWEDVPAGNNLGAAATVNGLCAGDYQITVTDANGCEKVETFTILEPADITFSPSTVSDATCNNSCDGSINASVAGGTPAYTLLWSPVPGAGQGTLAATGLCAGSYTLQVTDANGCAKDTTYDVTEPAPYDVSVSTTQTVCNGSCDGTADVVVNSGGTPGYTYTWSPAPGSGANNPSATGMCAGNYQITISDANACDSVINVVITQPATLVVNANVLSHVSCFGACTGSATAVVSGGVAPYTFSWDDPSSQSTQTASGLCAGTYQVTVTDASGCQETANVTINQPNAFDLTISQVEPTCAGSCNGSATVTVNSGGLAPYTISWDDPLGQITFTANGLCAGTYQATVTDANGCDTVVSFTLTDPPALQANISSSGSTCFGACTGEGYLDILGGTPGYSIQWFNAANAPQGVTNDTITGLCGGDYYAMVTDANGCSVASSNITITEDPQITGSMAVTDETCGVCDGTASLTAAGGAGSFSYAWTPAPGGGQGTPNATGLCSGVYQVQVTDANGCTHSFSATINSLATEVITFDSTNVTCNGGCNGTATANFTCIDAPCNVQWYDAASGLSIGQSGISATNLCAGSYIAQLTNGSGCVTSNQVEIIEPTAIITSVSGTDVTCNGSCNGTATVTASGGSGNFTYTWNPVPGSGQGSSNVIGLCQGWYVVSVQDDSLCVVLDSVLINEPTALVITDTAHMNASCAGVNDGSLSVNPTGGTPAYSVEWFDCATNLSTGLTGTTANGVGAGFYYAQVTDASGCVGQSPCMEITEPTPLDAAITVQSPTCFGQCSGMLVGQATGGTGTIFYQWMDAAQAPLLGETGDTLFNVCPGTYYLQLTDLSSCDTILGPINVLEPSPWNLTTTETDIQCSGSCDGAAGVNVLSGNTPPYSYSWSPGGMTTATVNNLCANTYTVTITDAIGCDTSISFLIEDNMPLLVNATVIDPACSGTCDGSIATAPSGGSAPYTFFWAPGGQSTSSITNQCAGNYQVTVTDANGCSVDSIISLSQPAQIIANEVTNVSTCGQCNGSITVNPTGGSGGYTYDWSPDPITGDGTNSVSNLCGGAYTVIITDSDGCSTVHGIAVGDIVAETISMSATAATCPDVCDGTATVTYTCNDPACSNEWYDAGTGMPIGQTSPVATNLCPGLYFVLVSNNSGCISADTVSVLAPMEFNVSSSLHHPSCNGDSDGAIAVSVSGGSGGYTYSWSPAPAVGQGTDSISQLTAGTYQLTVTDAMGCDTVIDLTIMDPPAINLTPTVTDILCSGDCNGALSVVATGGAGNFSYQWYQSGAPMVGETNNNINNLCMGNYNVDVTDQNGCTVNFPFDLTVSQPALLTATASAIDVACFGDCSGVAWVDISGGIGPFTIIWYNNTTGNPIGQTGDTAYNLCSGDYYAQITDNNGCNVFAIPTVTVGAPSILTYSTNTTGVTCFGNCDGSADIIAAGGTGPYSYNWTNLAGTPIPGNTNPSVNGLCAGIYLVDLMDANGCSIDDINVIINGTSPLNGNVFTNNAACGVNDGTATVFVSGGMSPYSYQWYDNTMTAIVGETDSTIQNIAAGTYFLEVIDANGCTDVFQADISNPGTFTLTWDNVSDPKCVGSADGFIDITISGGTPPYTTLWNPGGMTTEDISGLTEGTYEVKVTDANGCVSFFDTTLVNPSIITVAAIRTNPTCGQCDGELTLNPSGGTGTLDVLWAIGDTSTTISGLCPALYEALVTDSNGCTTTFQITLSSTNAPNIGLATTAVSCADECDGALNTSTSGGLAPYSYFWPSTGDTVPDLTGLCAGGYFLEVTDAAGCVRVSSFLVPGPPPIVADMYVTPPTCGNSDGAVTAIPSGGNPPYSYAWSHGPTTNAVSGLAPGLYTVTITDALGCDTTVAVPMSDWSSPLISLSGTEPTCAGDCDGEIVVTASGGTPGYSYQWYLDASAAGSGNDTLSNQCAGSYQVEVTDASGCIAVGTYQLEQPDSLYNSVPISLDITCNGLCDGEIHVSPGGGVQPFNFSWNDPSSSSAYNVTGLCTGTFDLSLTDANGCSLSASGTITEPIPLVLTLDSTVAANCPQDTAGAAYVTAIGGTPGYSFEWTLGGALAGNSEDLTSAIPGNYTAVLTDANGCTDTVFAAIDTLNILLAMAGSDTLICESDSLMLSGTFIAPGAVDSYWTDSIGNVISDTTDLSIDPSVGNTFYVFHVVDAVCIHSDTIWVDVPSGNMADAGPDVEIASTQSVVIGGSPTATDSTSITWDPGTYLDDVTLANPTVSYPIQSTVYIVTVTDTNGCIDTDTMFVSVIPMVDIPNGFSPNGDGVNDTWEIDLAVIYPDLEVEVYNRWGEQLFYSKGYSNRWDGTVKGKSVPVGTYYYVVKVNHPDYPDPFTGPLTIMR